ncbi:MAG: 3-deoxy-D-manno-octulosonic acid kinase [Succinivibrionaceae bacterium]|nr:3-deoxy-D-manno-octulosonic acid kinase [Succinivibrionaceae bacterium]
MEPRIIEPRPGVRLLVSGRLRQDAPYEHYLDFLDPARAMRLDPAHTLAGGRGTTVLCRIHGHDLALRHCRRGGLWGRLMGDRYWRWGAGSRRAFAEFSLLLDLRGLGLPVPEPYLAREEASGPFLRQDLVVGRLVGARDLAHLLAERPLARGEWELLGRTLGRFFACGVVHTDLNLRNVLLRGDEAFLIDFDKCRRERSLGAAQVEAMLSRLRRSFLKERRLRPGLHLDLEGLELLIDGARAHQGGAGA